MSILQAGLIVLLVMIVVALGWIVGECKDAPAGDDLWGDGYEKDDR